MAKSDPLRLLRHKSRKASERLGQIWAKAWPIHWRIFRQPDNLWKAVTKSSRQAQSALALSGVGLIISLLLVGSGLYALLTVEVPTAGGAFREAAVNNQFERFNPVLDANSPAEEKVTSLLYHPLYRVEYPDLENEPDQQPQIIPILLENSPEWLDTEAADPEDRFKTLEFRLKPNLRWSNNEPLGTSDVAYTFERLKEGRGNSRYRELFANVALETVDEQTFRLRSEVGNPGLQFSAGFSPISRDYFQAQTTDRLLNMAESVKPTVTSGYFTYSEGDIDDPDTVAQTAVANPVRRSDSNEIEKVILTRNPVSNFTTPQVDTYVFTNFEGIFSDSGTAQNSLVERAEAGLVDLYVQNLGTDLQAQTTNLDDELALASKKAGTNTYYSLFLNIRQGDYFVNRGLRQYVFCKLQEFSPSSDYQEILTRVPAQKRIVPVQMNVQRELACPENLDSLLLENEIAGAYSFQERTDGTREVLVFGQPIPTLELAGLGESTPLLEDIANYFRNEIGVEMNIVSEEAILNQALSEKTYHAAFLPITYTSPDLTSIYGAGGRDLNEIRRNRLVEPAVFEENLSRYSSSSYQDTEAREALGDFFAREFVVYNFYQTQVKYYYSEEVTGLADSLPTLQVFPEDVYTGLAGWFTNTTRRLDE